MSSSRKSQFGIIFLTVFIDMVGFGIVIPVLPRYAEHYGATAIQNGFLLATFSFAQFFASPILGRISDRIGRKPVLFISILGTALGFFLMGFANTLALLFVARLIDGIAGGNIGTAQSYLADISTRENRSKAMGLIGASIGLGLVFGPAVGGWMSSTFGYQSPMWLAGAMALINAFLVLAILPESLPPERRGDTKASLFEVVHHCDKRSYLFATAAYFFFVAGFSMMTFVFALFVWHRFQLDEFHTGSIFAMVGLIGVFIQGGLIGRLVKRFGEARLVIAGAFFMGIGLFTMPLAWNMPSFLGFCVITAIGNSLMIPTLTGLASRSVNPQWQGRALGLFQSAGSLARWMGPAVAGFLLAKDLLRGPAAYGRGPLWAGALLVAISLILALFLPKTPFSERPIDTAGR